MNTAAEVLLIIVSGVLALFLIVGIFALVKVIQILSTLKKITDQAERIADSAEAAAEFFRKSAKPVALMRVVSNIVESAFHKRKGGKHED